MCIRDSFPADGTTRRFRDITDGSSNTLVVTEVPSNAAIHWMNPADNGAIELLLALSEDSETPHMGGVQAAFGDGSVRFLHTNTRRDALQAMITPDADDVIPSDSDPN